MFHTDRDTHKKYMKKHLDFSLILPCFNEETHFPGSVAQILTTLSRLRYRYEVIFVDDGSTDKTQEMIRTVCKKNRHCRFFFHTKNQGRGQAVTTGIRSAKASIAGYMDIDCEVSPLYIPLFVDAIKQKKADVAVGRRIYQTGFSTLLRWILSVGYRHLADFILATRGIDTESGYKFFNKKRFLPVLQRIQSTGWFWDTESIVLSMRKKLHVMEIPVLFIRRNDKPSSVRIVRDTVSYLISLIRFCFYHPHRTPKSVHMRQGKSG